MADLKNERLLVIAPHPDDEVIGSGGLIKKVKDAGGKVYVLYLTNGDTKDFSKEGFSSREERDSEIKKVAKFLNFDDYEIAFEGNEYHLQLDILGQLPLMEAIERTSKVSIQNVKPTIIASPSHYSYNQDHRAAAEAVHAALRPSSKGSKHIVSKVIAYEEAVDVWSIRPQTPPNFFVSLTKEQFDAKIEAMRKYDSQMRDYPNMRSIKILESLAVLRGSVIGEEYTEAYHVLKDEL